MDDKIFSKKPGNMGGESDVPHLIHPWGTVYPKKYSHGFCFAVLCCGYTLADFPLSIRLTSLALWQSNDCPSASKATLMNMDKYFMWINYERLYNHNKAKHNKTVCIFHGIYCNCQVSEVAYWWHLYNQEHAITMIEISEYLENSVYGEYLFICIHTNNYWQ